MNAIALNILMVIKRLFCCIFSFLLPFILLRIGGYFYTTKTSTFSHPDYTVGFRFTLNQPLLLKGRRLKLLPVGNYTLPEDELLNLSFKIYITRINLSLQYVCLFIKMRDMFHQFHRLILN